MNTVNFEAGMLIPLIPVIILALLLIAWSLIDMARRPVKHLPAWVWALIVLMAIPLGSVVQFKLFAEALAAEATFNEIALRGTVGGIDASHQIDEKRAVGVVNAGAGFAFRF